MITKKIAVYTLDNTFFAPLENADFLKTHFCLRIEDLPFPCIEQDLIRIPDAFTLRWVCRSIDDENAENARREGCFYYNEEKEWLLEAECAMETEDQAKKETFFVRLPRSAPFVSEGMTLQFCFDGTWLRFLDENGELLNENSGLANFCAPSDALWVANGLAVTVQTDVKATVSYREVVCDGSADFYFPYHWNSFVGDVMTFTHDGTYHVIYLYDRRHHASRNGRGAHYITQLTTRDLVHWQEEVPIAVIDRPWKTMGTGTMLFHEGKYYMSYGLHTERYHDNREKIIPAFDQEKKQWIPLSFDEVYRRGGLPAGATYSVSEDGVHFTESEMLYLPGRNPSAYTNDKGGVTTYSGYAGSGVWQAERFGAPFCESPSNFAFAWDAVAMKNSDECPAFFSWNGYRYLAAGFTGYYRTLTPNSDDFADATVLGEYFYDGLSVPMIAEWKDNRRLIAGWVGHPYGWGGVLMQRELVQEANGKLGLKWIPELIPQKRGENLLTEAVTPKKAIALPKKESCFIEMTVDPKNATALRLHFGEGENATELCLNFAERRAQFSQTTRDTFAPRLSTDYEQITKEGVAPREANHPHWPSSYALCDMLDASEPFRLRLICRSSRRYRGTVYDVELAGKRTMIWKHYNLFPDTLTLYSDGDLTVSDVSLHRIDAVE